MALTPAVLTAICGEMAVSLYHFLENVRYWGFAGEIFGRGVRGRFDLETFEKQVLFITYKQLYK